MKSSFFVLCSCQNSVKYREVAGNVFSTIGSGRSKFRLDPLLVSLARVGLLSQVGEAELEKAHCSSKLAPERLLQNTVVLAAHLVLLYT